MEPQPLKVECMFLVRAYKGLGRLLREGSTFTTGYSVGGQRRQSGNLTVSTDLPSADDASHQPSPVASIVRSPYAGRPPSARTDSLLLKTLSVAGGHSRAGSVAGWESLEGYENALSEMTSETSNFFNSPFALKPIPASALPTSRGR